MKNNTLNVLVKTNDPEPLWKLFGKSNKIFQDGFSCEIRNTQNIHGAIEQEFILEILINIGIGISTGIISSWIYNKLSREKENSLQINNTIVYTKQDIELQINQYFQNRNAEQGDETT